MGASDQNSLDQFFFLSLVDFVLVQLRFSDGSDLDQSWFSRDNFLLFSQDLCENQSEPTGALHSESTDTSLVFVFSDHFNSFIFGGIHITALKK